MAVKNSAPWYREPWLWLVMSGPATLPAVAPDANEWMARRSTNLTPSSTFFGPGR